MQIQDPFGQRTWNTLRGRLFVTLRGRWYSMSNEDIEDAVGEAVCDLVDYWSGLPSSLTEDTDQNFRYAMKHGLHRANRYLASVAEERGFLEPLPGPENEDHERFRQPSAEDVYITSTDDLLDELLALASPADMDNWLRDLLDGLTEEQAAENVGVSRQAINKRRRAGVDRMRELTRN